MHALAIFSLATFWLASVLVGAQLVRLWMRTGELPEFLIGSAFLAGGVAATGCILALRLELAPPAAVPVLTLLARAAGSWSAASMVVLAWRVFRPGAAWARALALAALGLVLLRLGGEAWVQRPREDLTHPLFYGWTLLTLFAYGWTSLEALLYQKQLRRRMGIGLADPVVANRILLWGVAAACIAVQGPLQAASAGLGGAASPSPALRVGLSSLSLVCAACIGLAFFPPRAYLGWIAGRPGSAARRTG